MITMNLNDRIRKTTGSDCVYTWDIHVQNSNTLIVLLESEQ
jgi:hypothetical protein